MKIGRRAQCWRNLQEIYNKLTPVRRKVHCYFWEMAKVKKISLWTGNRYEQSCIFYQIKTFKSKMIFCWTASVIPRCSSKLPCLPRSRSDRSVSLSLQKRQRLSQSLPRGWEILSSTAKRPWQQVLLPIFNTVSVQNSDGSPSGFRTQSPNLAINH